VSLNLMNAVAESLDRAILFVIQQDHLIPVGSFGLATTKQKLEEITRGLRLSLREPSVFSECVESGGAYLSSDQRSSVPPSFRELVGAPRTGEFALLPVSGSQRVIALIYVDNGNKDRPIADLQVLELAAFQLGLALENEFLRRARSPKHPTEQGAPPLRSMG
jgi:GAF domain-containing protein